MVLGSGMENGGSMMNLGAIPPAVLAGGETSMGSWPSLKAGISISVGNNIILQYIAPFQAYYISTILRIAISY